MTPVWTRGLRCHGCDVKTSASPYGFDIGALHPSVVRTAHAVNQSWDALKKVLDVEWEETGRGLR